MLINVDKLIERRENIDNLLTKSDDLSKTSRDFEKWAKKQNQCCKYYLKKI
jgi:synaptobrevin family protein YKT6